MSTASNRPSTRCPPTPRCDSVDGRRTRPALMDASAPASVIEASLVPDASGTPDASLPSTAAVAESSRANTTAEAPLRALGTTEQIAIRMPSPTEMSQIRGEGNGQPLWQPM